jgi:hypothetical protein
MDFETVKPHREARHTTMADYVDGFVIPVPENKIDDYRRIAQRQERSRNGRNIDNRTLAVREIRRLRIGSL